MNKLEWTLRAKRHEQASEWIKAEACWKLAGNVDESRICRRIINSISRGDAYRKDIEKIDKNLLSSEYAAAVGEVYKKHYK